MSPSTVFLLPLFVVAVLALPSRRQDVRELQAVQLASANNDFAVRLYRKLPQRQNVFYSPLSVTAAISMLYAGTHGTTERETGRALGFDKAGLEASDVHQTFRYLLHELTETNDDYLLDVANRVLTDANVHVRDEYIDTLRKHYDAQVDEVDFVREGEGVKNKVNDWVNEKTRGKISSLLDQAPEADTVLLLLNAVYFKGTWKTQFDEKETKPRVFHNDGTAQKRVQIMHVETKVNYADSTELKSQVIELPYVGEDLSMVVVLPYEQDGLQEVEERLTSDNLQKAVDDLYPVDGVDILLPRFKFEQKYSLNEPLKAIGLQEVFEDNADLSGISDSVALKVSDVIQKAVVEVNEQGSEAAAVTGTRIHIPLPLPPPPKPTFHADHPFLFYIRERSTGLILFMGRVNEL